MFWRARCDGKCSQKTSSTSGPPMATGGSRAPQARAAIRRTPARQRQAHLPPDEEARIAAAALYRPTPTRRARRQIITIRSNIRWCADALEFTCWNGEIVRIAFVLDCHDREVIAWLATTAGISGEMIRDMMIECVERRFGGSRAPHKVQWLTDNGSIFAAYKTMNIALALNLFTRTPGWAIAHRENTSMLNPNPPRVRSDRST